MELKFKESTFPYLVQVVGEVRNQEQTQEIKLTDGMPDIGRILGAWGQVVLRSKEWRSDCILFSGGMMVWVLYQPEDGSQIRVLDSWVPFQIKWDLPEDCSEGSILLKCITRFVDARSVSPRKIMIRAGIAALGEGFTASEAITFGPEENLQNVELLQTKYAVQLPKEAGETRFLIDEELDLSPAGNHSNHLIYYTVDPEISDKKVIGNKIAFRGNCNLHVLYETGDGKLESQNYVLPFSQFAELRTAYGSDAETSIELCVTNLEVELGEQGRIRVKSGLVAQYLIRDTECIDTIEDAYIPGRELAIQREILELPLYQNTFRETIFSEQNLSMPSGEVVDVSVLSDFVRQERTEEGIRLEAPCSVFVLAYGDQGELQPVGIRLEGYTTIKSDAEQHLRVMPLHGSQPMFGISNGRASVKVEMPVEIASASAREVPVVSGLNMNEESEPDPGRPSLILRRAGGERLWDIAKSCGSTVGAIRNANHLEGEVAQNQILLIPVS